MRQLGSILAVPGWKTINGHNEMAISSCFDDSPATTSGEVVAMAAVMEGRDGQYAADIEEFFSLWHSQKGDQRRAGAWMKVAEHVRQREFFRTHGTAEAAIAE